jgi:5-methyltetrahydropteroyltriglutamate--homocysteine methyltransferase
MDPERLRRVLDDLVRFAIRLQEQAGLDVVSDGEWRRTQYSRRRSTRRTRR